MKLRKIAVVAAIPAIAAVIGGCGGNAGNGSACTGFYKALGNTHQSAFAYSNGLIAAANEASGQTQTDMMTVAEDVTADGIPVPSDLMAVGHDCNSSS